MKGSTGTQSPSVRPAATTTSAARFFGTPRKRSQVSVPPLSSCTVLASTPTTRVLGRNAIPRSSKAARIAFDVSGDGGTGEGKGLTSVIRVLSTSPRAVTEGVST